MDDDRARALLRELSEHFGEPVMPVSQYCAAFELWAGALRDKAQRTQDQGDQETAGIVDFVFRRLVPKSNLLWRMIYDGEALRTEPCPVHQGTFSGVGTCDCNSGSILTGWLAGTDRREDFRDRVTKVLAGRCECGRSFPIGILKLLVARDART